MHFSYECDYLLRHDTCDPILDLYAPLLLSSVSALQVFYIQMAFLFTSLLWLNRVQCPHPESGHSPDPDNAHGCLPDGFYHAVHRVAATVPATIRVADTRFLVTGFLHAGH